MVNYVVIQESKAHLCLVVKLVDGKVVGVSSTVFGSEIQNGMEIDWNGERFAVSRLTFRPRLSEISSNLAVSILVGGTDPAQIPSVGQDGPFQKSALHGLGRSPYLRHLCYLLNLVYHFDEFAGWGDNCRECLLP